MNHYTKTTVVCCNPIFWHNSLCMNHRTTLHVRVLTQARPNNLTCTIVAHVHIIHMHPAIDDIYCCLVFMLNC